MYTFNNFVMHHCFGFKLNLKTIIVFSNHENFQINFKWDTEQEYHKLNDFPLNPICILVARFFFLFFSFLEGRDDPNTTKSGPSSVRQRMAPFMNHECCQ